MSGPILVRHDASRLDRRTADRWPQSIAKRAGMGGVHPARAAGGVHHVRPRGREVRALRGAPSQSGTRSRYGRENATVASDVVAEQRLTDVPWVDTEVSEQLVGHGVLDLDHAEKE